MDPNSKNQIWSFWQYDVYPTPLKQANFATVKLNCARFGKLVFGSASEMNIIGGTDQQGRFRWSIKVLSEGHPVHDPQFTERMHADWRKFFEEGFGHGCEVRCHARLAAGDKQDGKPADQLIILPSIVEENFPNG